MLLVEEIAQREVVEMALVAGQEQEGALPARLPDTFDVRRVDLEPGVGAFEHPAEHELQGAAGGCVRHGLQFP